MTTSGSPCIELTGVTCGYGNNAVVADCSLSISPGEVVALIGANGSGKSTLMKTIAGAIGPLAGRVRLMGDDVTSMTKREIARRLGYVPQIESPAFDFKVRDVVLMGRMPHSDGLFETTEDRAAAELAMLRADCKDLADRPMSELSGGEGQRVRIARALAQDAPMLLMDEPTTHLDVRHQIETGRLVRGLALDGLAVLVAVHDLNWAAAFATRAVLLSEGVVALDGPMPETLESPVIDQAFGVEFQRIREEGLWLLAKEGG
jgi:iron complex transport system ATP-binding protein